MKNEFKLTSAQPQTPKRLWMAANDQLWFTDDFGNDYPIGTLMDQHNSLIELKIRLDSLVIKWYKRGNSAANWDQAIEELQEEYKI